MIHLKRAYEPPSKSDGYRILVERLWPRGLTKERAAINLWLKEIAPSPIDLWLKEIAPSPELRKWFNHDPAKWDEFRQRYRGELKGNQESTRRLAELLESHDTVTFVYAARDEQHNSALLLKEFIDQQPKS
jgi:uncharacterized protein YeaO (DUF488 family)